MPRNATGSCPGSGLSLICVWRARWRQALWFCCVPCTSCRYRNNGARHHVHAARPRRRILNPVAHQAVSKGGTVPLGEVLPLASSLVGTEPSTPPLSANSHLGSTISKTRWSSPLTVATSGKRVHCPFCELPPRRWHSLTLCGPRFQPAPAKAAALSTTGQQRAV